MKKNKTLSIKEIGKVVAISGPVIKIKGLPDVKMGEMLLVGKEKAIVFQFDQEFIEGIIDEYFVYALSFGGEKDIQMNDEVRMTGKIFEVPVGPNFIGKVIDPLGRDIDSKKEIKGDSFRPVESLPPEITEREQVREPLETGIKIIDSLFPIGRGQRELIVGDRKTGKTVIGIDAILNQKDMVCIYVSIGQQRAGIIQNIKTLKEKGAFDYTTVVVASSSDPPVLQYLAPFSAMALAEYFREKGNDVLIVFDDLTRHAWVWREISLQLKRPPGRESYPGDIFYLHARLLERAAKFNKESGGGSISALPICETEEGDISEYIPTNLISITDGQLYLETNLFQKGAMPAINVGLSVSRVGSQAQEKHMKEITSGLKLILSQHRELKKLLQLETKISEEAKKKFKRGEIFLNIFKQKKHQAVEATKQSLIYFAILEGFLDDLEIDKVKNFEMNFYQFIDKFHPELKNSLKRDGWSDEIKEKSRKIIKDFKETNFSL